MVATQASVGPTYLQADGKRRKLGQAVIWFGLIAPLAVSESRPASEIAADPITAMTVFRGATPILCLLVAAVLLRPRPRIQNVPEGLAIAFATVAVLSTFWSIAPLPTLLKALVLAATYGLVILLARTWRSLRDATADLLTAAQSLVVTSLLGIAIAPEQAFPAYYGWGGPIRLFGVLPEVHPVPLGVLAAVGLLGALSGIGRWQWQRNPSGRASLLVACLTVLALAHTRSAWVMTPVAIVVYLVLVGRVRWAVRVSLSLVAAALLLLSIPAARAPVSEMVTRGDGTEGMMSLGGRLPMWKVGTDVWANRPVTGYGYYAGHRYGPYPEALSALRGREMSEYAHIDSAYIETAVDLGLLGLIPIVALVGLGGYFLIHRDWTLEQGAVVSVPVAGILVVDSLLSYSLQVPSYQGQFLLALLLASAPRGMYEEGPQVADLVGHRKNVGDH